MTEPFSMPIVPRYAEVDQQGVVFNAHYLTWFDEASNCYFDFLGLPFTEFEAWGCDVQVVHADVDYLGPVRWHDAVRIEARCDAVGTTSFALRFDVFRRGADGAHVMAVSGRIVYVVVSTAGWAKRVIPPDLRAALTSVAGQGRNATNGGTVCP